MSFMMHREAKPESEIRPAACPRSARGARHLRGPPFPQGRPRSPPAAEPASATGVKMWKKQERRQPAGSGDWLGALSSASSGQDDAWRPSAADEDVVARGCVQDASAAVHLPAATEHPLSVFLDESSRADLASWDALPKFTGQSAGISGDADTRPPRGESAETTAHATSDGCNVRKVVSFEQDHRLDQSAGGASAASTASASSVGARDSAASRPEAGAPWLYYGGMRSGEPGSGTGQERSCCPACHTPTRGTVLSAAARETADGIGATCDNSRWGWNGEPPFCCLCATLRGLGRLSHFGCATCTSKRKFFYKKTSFFRPACRHCKKPFSQHVNPEGSLYPRCPRDDVPARQATL